jgi:hypothetical protein
MTAAPATQSRNLLIVILQSLKRLEPLKRLERLEPAGDHDARAEIVHLKLGSPTCIKLTSSFGLDAKLFTRIASVYPDRCEQSLE